LAGKTQKVAVIGIGYVGATTAGILASCNYEVVALDTDRKKVDQINRGRLPFFEQGLDKLVKRAVEKGRLAAATDYEKLRDADLVFSCVGTPDNPDGSSNLQYVFEAAAEAAKHMPDGAVFVQKSTVPVGTGGKIEKIFADSGKKLPYVSNPEFLREGTAITDSLWFDRVVAGSSDKRTAQKVLDLYRSVEKCREEIAAEAGVSPASRPAGQFIITNRNSAELIKVTANAFLVLKITFANSIAKLADRAGADINEVMDAVGADQRIGRAFLNAGRGYGGGCFPKDVTGLISSATEQGVDLSIMIAAVDENESMPGYIANKAKSVLGDFKGKKIAVLGLAFKSGTSDARRSPGVKLANLMARDGAEVTAYDPQANEEAAADLRKSVRLCDSAEEATKGMDAVFVATDWPQFVGMDLDALRKSQRGDLFVDCMNRFDTATVEAAGFKYLGVGR
jgi:UDPglucose 6-dehydrogenase